MGIVARKKSGFFHSDYGNRKKNQNHDFLLKKMKTQIKIITDSNESH